MNKYMTYEEILQINISVLCGIIWGNIILTTVVYIVNKYTN